VCDMLQLHANQEDEVVAGLGSADAALVCTVCFVGLVFAIELRDCSCSVQCIQSAWSRLVVGRHCLRDGPPVALPLFSPFQLLPRNCVSLSSVPQQVQGVVRGLRRVRRRGWCFHRRHRYHRGPCSLRRLMWLEATSSCIV